MNSTTSKKIKVLRLRLKDKHARFLRGLAREVNFVWNYCNELQVTMFNRERRFLSGYDFAKFTRGATLDSTSHSARARRSVRARSMPKSRIAGKTPCISFRPAWCTGMTLYLSEM
jgi:putative transposase